MREEEKETQAGRAPSGGGLSALAPAGVAVRLLVALTLVCGVLYPLLVTGLAQALFPHPANGSLLSTGRSGHETIIGSSLIGQAFSGPGYFWGRPSATSPFPYNAAASTGSNLGPTNPALLSAVKARVEALRAAHPQERGLIPGDLATASASGLDPHISPAAALYQVPRVAQQRGLQEGVVRQLVDQTIEGRQWGVLGEPRVNVLVLNLALDHLKP